MSTHKDSADISKKDTPLLKKAPIQMYNELSIRRNEIDSLARIFQELKNGFEFLKKYPKSVSFFGSARFAPDNPYCLKAEELAQRIVHDLKYSVITGGGPGIMEAANKGAYHAGGESIGITIKLPQEQVTNKHVNSEQSFQYFFTRKTILTFAAEAYIVFPGGYGTLDEFFEIVTLIQTGKIPKVPVFLFGASYWNPLFQFMKEKMFAELGVISEEDLSIFTITDDLDTILNGIKAAPVSRWWRDIER